MKAEGTLLSRVPRDVRLIQLGTRRVVNSVPALARYLRRERPSVLLSTLNTANAVAVLAKLVARQPVRVVIRQACTSLATSRTRRSPWRCSIASSCVGYIRGLTR